MEVRSPVWTMFQSKHTKQNPYLQYVSYLAREYFAVTFNFLKM